MLHSQFYIILLIQLLFFIFLSAHLLLCICIYLSGSNQVRMYVFSVTFHTVIHKDTERFRLNHSEYVQWNVFISLLTLYRVCCLDINSNSNHLEPDRIRRKLLLLNLSVWRDDGLAAARLRRENRLEQLKPTKV